MAGVSGAKRERDREGRKGEREREGSIRLVFCVGNGGFYASVSFITGGRNHACGREHPTEGKNLRGHVSFADAGRVRVYLHIEETTRM